MKKAVTKKAVKKAATTPVAKKAALQAKQAKAAVKRAVKPKSPRIPVQMSFGEAVMRAQAHGVKISRLGWNGKGQFVIWIPGQKKVPLAAGTPYAQAFPKRKFIEICGHFDMFTSAKQMQPGWLASQGDMAANDWVVVK